MIDRIFTIPNILTASRIFLAPLVAFSLLRGEFRQALWLLLVAGVTDALDGFIARLFNQYSRLGACLDPIADKLLMLATVLTLTTIGLLPLWITLPILLRDLIIFVGALVYYRRAGNIEMSPTTLSKANTCAQIGLLLMVVATHATILPMGRFIFPAFLLVFCTTLTSGVQYLIIWGKKAAALESIA